MRRCERCTLPESFPGAALDEHGLCEFCRRAPSPELDRQHRQLVGQRFGQLARRLRGHQPYDCLVSWSGGKDSTYVLTMLKEDYGLQPLALTFDNGFVSPRAFENCRAIAARLGVDHLIVAPRFDLLRRLYAASLDGSAFPRAALRRTSGICNACMGMAKLVALQTAQEKRVPLLAYGWSPGQIPLSSALLTYTPALVRTMLDSSATVLQRLVGEDLAAYLPTEPAQGPQAELHSVSPLAFWDYDEAHIRRRIGALGWQPPDDTDPNSSNCLLNAFASETHRRQFEYHPYDMELASLVRKGYLDRQEALRRLEELPPPAVLAAIRARLGLGDGEVGAGGVPDQS